MKKSFLFVKRNLKEMLRDPILYCFCIGFPIMMVVMFQVIMACSGNQSVTFEVPNLIPGIMMFSYSVLMLMSSLLISKDRTSAFLKRLYTSPMKGKDYIIGYGIPFVIVGLGQTILCVILGYIFGAVDGTHFIAFPRALLLMITMLPILLINVFIGMTLGMVLNDKAAPGITSIFISLSGVLGGAWMPLDTMGSFEKFTLALPFYPSVYLGRVAAGAPHTVPDELGNLVPYSLSGDVRGIIVPCVLAAYLLVTGALTLLVFNKKINSDN